MARPTNRITGFSLTELLVVIAVIIVLVGLLLAALAPVRKQALMTESMNNMKQIAGWMTLYSQDNRETIVPSQFDYSANSYPGKPRSQASLSATERYRGTWTDILWTTYAQFKFPEADTPIGHDYSFDSPDAALYRLNPDIDKNPFRSAVKNTRELLAADGTPTPFGQGARELDLPGFFAANNFFDSQPTALNPRGNWYSMGQIRSPNRSLYLIDSFAGETIQPEAGPFHANDDDASGLASLREVDFRYNGVALILFLDAHVEPISPWGNLCGGLEPNPAQPNQTSRNVRVRDLTNPPPGCP